MRDAGFGMRDSGFGVRDSGCGVRDAGLSDLRSPPRCSVRVFSKPADCPDGSLVPIKALTVEYDIQCMESRRNSVTSRW